MFSKKSVLRNFTKLKKKTPVPESIHQAVSLCPLQVHGQI